MLSCLITEKAFSFMLHNQEIPITLWTQSCTVYPTCLQQHHRPVSPSQPQAQALILNIFKWCVHYKQKFFSTVWILSSSRCNVNLTVKKDTSSRDKSSSFGWSDSKMLIWRKRREAVVFNLACSVETWTSCHYLQMLICLSPTDFTEKEFLPLVSSNRSV